MLKYKRIGITAKPNLTAKDESVCAILDIVRKTGAEVFIDPAALDDVSKVRMLPRLEADTAIDLMLVIGGDGTILRAVRQLSDRSVPVLGVNRGVLGFLAEVGMEEAAEVIPSFLAGDGKIDERRMLDVIVERDGKSVFTGSALNEAVIAQGTIARLLDLRTEVSNEPLATFHADGLIVATPTGSTAYALAAGGPVVHPALSALILAPINPHSLTQKPVVIPGDSNVTVEVIQSGSDFHDTHVGLTLDGQVYFELGRGDRVSVCVNNTPALFLRRPHDRFFFTLRSKLRWGDGI
jgi:NAD+ kinase